MDVKSKRGNKPISVDLRPFLRPEQATQRGVSKESCQYLGCGYLPERPSGEAQSPLNGRVVFQVRGLMEEGTTLKSVILSHIGRALTDRQEATNGKYWGFPFHKSLEIYNQDKLLMDPAATEQVKEFGLVLVEGFFDVAALVEAGCLNGGALMGAHITAEQIDRLKFINAHVPVPRITLFLDRDEAGRQGTKRAAALLEQNGFVKPYTDREIKKREKVKIAGCLPALRRVFKGEIDLPIKEGKDMGKVGWPKGKKRGKRKAGRPKTRTSANGSADAEFSAITHNGRVYVALEDAQRIFGR